MDLIERLADLEHQQWAHWTRYMLDHLTPENVERWRRQCDTPYADLTEKEKESDREWALKVQRLWFEELSAVAKKMSGQQAQAVDLPSLIRSSMAVLDLDESDRQALVLCLALCSLERPGWTWYLGTIAEKLGRMEMYQRFRDANMAPIEELDIARGCLLRILQREPLQGYTFAELLDGVAGKDYREALAKLVNAGKVNHAEHQGQIYYAAVAEDLGDR